MYLLIESMPSQLVPLPFCTFNMLLLVFLSVSSSNLSIFEQRRGRDPSSGQATLGHIGRHRGGKEQKHKNGNLEARWKRYE